VAAWVHAPDDAANIPRSAIDLVQHAPGIGDEDEPAFGERSCVDEFIAGAAAERHRIGELEVLDVTLVDPCQWRIALAVVSAVIHQPVLRLLVRIDQPIRCDVGCQCGRCHNEHAACEQGISDRTREACLGSCHDVLPFINSRYGQSIPAEPAWERPYVETRTGGRRCEIRAARLLDFGSRAKEAIGRNEMQADMGWRTTLWPIRQR